jgi:hypothetical protein
VYDVAYGSYLLNCKLPTGQDGTAFRSVPFHLGPHTVDKLNRYLPYATLYTQPLDDGLYGSPKHVTQDRKNRVKA